MSPPQEQQQVFYPPLHNGIPMPWNILPQAELNHTEDHSFHKLLSIPVDSSSYGDFSIKEIALATDNFALTNVVGEGEFGVVFKGLLPNGRRVAVRLLHEKLVERPECEFVEDVEIISRPHHNNVVKMVGYCIISHIRMLVHEFISNKSLDFHLHSKLSLSTSNLYILNVHFFF